MEPWWNPGGTLVEPWWNPGGTLQLLGKKRTNNSQNPRGTPGPSLPLVLMPPCKAKLRVTAQACPRRRNRGPIGADGAIGARSGPDGGARRCNRGPIGARRCNRAPIFPWCNPSHPLNAGDPWHAEGNCIYSKTRRCELGTIDRARRCNRAPIVPWRNPSHPYYSSTPVFLCVRIATASIAKLGAESGPVGARWRNRDRSGPKAPTVQSGPDLGPVNLEPFSRNFRGAQRETLLEPFLRAAP